MCSYSFQICHSVDEQTMKEYIEYYGFSDLNSYWNGSNAIIDINPEFVEDIRIILEEFNNNTYVTRIIMLLVSDFRQ